MIEHMVWIKFHGGVTEHRIAEHVAALAGLAQSVPGIVELKIGKNMTDRAAGCTHGLIVRFASKQDLQTYITHPNHVAVANPLFEDADVMAMDIEC